MAENDRIRIDLRYEFCVNIVVDDDQIYVCRLNQSSIYTSMQECPEVAMPGHFLSFFIQQLTAQQCV
ncbi:hypothetical protein TNCV_1617051 [Trichonephila clavipes]|nr:hypothetical protein TNCV_1617051 [Trichonephila clavipes]